MIEAISHLIHRCGKTFWARLRSLRRPCLACTRVGTRGRAAFAHGRRAQRPRPRGMQALAACRSGCLSLGCCWLGGHQNVRTVRAARHLACSARRDYEAIVKDFVTLDFIPRGTDLRPILPVLARVFDSALAGGGAKGVNFNFQVRTRADRPGHSARVDRPGHAAPMAIAFCVALAPCCRNWQRISLRSPLTTRSASRPTLPSSSAPSACSRVSVCACL